MDSTRWERIQSLFHEVADRPEPEQRALLTTACGGDDGLMADVLILLEEDARGASLLDRDLAHVAQEVLDGERRVAQLLVGPLDQGRLQRLVRREVGHEQAGDHDRHQPEQDRDDDRDRQ